MYPVCIDGRLEFQRAVLQQFDSSNLRDLDQESWGALVINIEIVRLSVFNQERYAVAENGDERCFVLSSQLEAGLIDGNKYARSWNVVCWFKGYEKIKCFQSKSCWLHEKKFRSLELAVQRVFLEQNFTIKPQKQLSIRYIGRTWNEKYLIPSLMPPKERKRWTKIPYVQVSRPKIKPPK